MYQPYSANYPLRRIRMVVPPQRSERNNSPVGGVKKRTPFNERSEAFVRFSRQGVKL